jgi:integrase
MEDYPYVSDAPDRHGVVRYRFRRAGKSLYLPGEPGDADFEEAYKAVLEGREPRKAAVIPHPKAIITGSFADAWRLVQNSAEWRKLDEATKYKNERLTNEFLKSKVAEGAADAWATMPISDLRRRHIRTILASYADTPHKAKHLLTAIRRLLGEALDQDWIEHDPSLKIGWRPEYTGWRAWTLDERRAFEAKWPNGSMPRAAYALALWAGNRRSDVASQLWNDVDFEGERITVRQVKTGKVLRLLLLPMLREALMDLPRRTETVISNAYGNSFSDKSLTGMMAHWTFLAGMGEKSGCTFHGLRKTLGKYLAEEGATSKQAGGILGHDDLDHVELYSREAEQERLAVDGMSKLLKRFV